ncbi:hypothetical protein LTR53_019033, partial [Teratosphaeriaceae sp. CCFEE 6253]
MADQSQAATPEAVHDAGNPMSDDIRSSPTPSSHKDTDSGPIAMDEDGMSEDELAQDPPSSPPPEIEDPPQQPVKSSAEEGTDQVANGPREAESTGVRHAESPAREPDTARGHHDIGSD